jgi:hypothetical protein
MFKKIVSIVVSVFLLASLYGCAAVIVGAAAGTGTAIWLSGKLSQEVDGSYDDTVQAVKKALDSMRLRVEKETKKDDITQVISRYNDDSKIWIDVRPITQTTSKVEIRVGFSGNKEVSRKILDRILKYL